MQKQRPTVYLLLLCLFFLWGFTDASVEESIRALTSNDADIKREASERLIGMGSDAVKPVIVLLEEGDASTRKEAVFILGAIGDTRAAESLTVALGDEDADVCLAATWALVKLGSPAVPLLIDALGTKKREMLLAVETALVKIGKSAIPSLVEALGSRNSDIRRNSVRILGRIRDPRCADALRKARKDKDETVRREASIALEKVMN